MQMSVNKALTLARGREEARGSGQKFPTVHVRTLPVLGESGGEGAAAESSFFSPIYFRPRWNSRFRRCASGSLESCPSQGLKQHMKKKLLSLGR